MKHNEYLEKLSRLYKWKLGDLYRGKRRGPKSKVENGTYPVELLEAHLNPAACKHCGCICDQAPTLTHRYENGVWVCKCETCKRFQNPDNQKFEWRLAQMGAYVRKLSKRKR